MINNHPNVKSRNFSFKIIISTIVSIAIIGAIISPILVNCGLSKTFLKSAPDLTNKDWLSFWGGYLGGIVGMIGTIIALVVTILANKKQNEQTRNEINETNRLNILPIIEWKDEPVDLSINPNNHSSQDMLITVSENEVEYHLVSNYEASIKNILVKGSLIKIACKDVGLGTAIGCFLTIENDTHIGTIDSLRPGETKYIYFDFKYPRECNFYIYFKDAQGHKYSQLYSINSINSVLSLSKISLPQFCPINF